MAEDRDRLTDVINALNSVIGYLRRERDRQKGSPLLDPLDAADIGRIGYGRAVLDDDLPTEIEVQASEPAAPTAVAGGFENVLDPPPAVESPMGYILPDESGIIPCYAEKDGGTAGDASTTCSFTYTLYAEDQTTILVKNVDGDNATGMTPEKDRLVETKYTTPTGKNRALAYRDSTGEIHLWDANEVPYPPEEC